MKLKNQIEADAKINHLAAQISTATDNNAHTKAVCLLAYYLGGKYPRITGAIEIIHNVEGSMHRCLIEYRSELKKEMMEVLSTQVTAEQYEKIKAAF